MKIKNETRLDTRQLKTLILQVGKRELWSADYRRRLVVRVKPRTRSHGSMGQAFVGTAQFPATSFRLFLTENDDPRDIARVIAHESAHNHGLKHRQMPRSYFHGVTPELWDWAYAYPIRYVDTVTKRRVTGAAADQVKLDHAQKMLFVAEIRVKRAERLLRRWKVKTRYYERKLAATKGEQ